MENHQEGSVDQKVEVTDDKTLSDCGVEIFSMEMEFVALCADMQECP